MAARFVIRRNVNNHPLTQYDWVLEDGDGNALVNSAQWFPAEQQARSHIARVKKAAQKFTKVVIEEE